MKNPLFSILIANYNNGKYFEDCYKSIIAQTYTNWEVIIVDDGSIDDSVALIKKNIGEDSRFKFYENTENKGCGYTKRKCAELATGEICAFLDPDDAITTDALSLMVAKHMKFPDAAIVYSRYFHCDANLKIKYESKTEQVINGDSFYLGDKISHFLTFKNRLYKKTEGINSYLLRGIDKDLILKLYEVGDCIFFDKPLYKYRIHNNGISLGGNEEKAYFWYWVAIIDAAKRRNINIENIYVEKALTSRREFYLQKEIDSYNKSFIFRALRKLGVFKIF